MKIKTIILGMLLLTVMSCKKEAKATTTTAVKETVEKETVEKEESKAIKPIAGEFLYYADAAVLKTPTQVYGVVIDAKMHELAKQVAPLKKADTDMVEVVLKGEIVPKNADEEGWPFKVIIKEIVEVKQVATDDNVVIKKEKN